MTDATSTSQDGNMVNLGYSERTAKSDKAIRVHIFDLDDELWVPISQIHDDSDVYGGGDGRGNLIVSDWWAEKNGYL